MDYLEVVIPIKGDNNFVKEVLIAELSHNGFSGFIEENFCVKAYIPKSDFQEFIFNNILHQKLVGDFIDFEGLEFNVIQEKNWNEEWEKNYFEPIAIGNEILVRGSFHAPQPDYKYEIIIDPKMSFGTGHHQTTKLMLSCMQQFDFNNKFVIDMGTGTGILAIYAAQKGATKIKAIDIDEWSVENAIENIALNQLGGKIQVLKGDARLLNQMEEKCDFLLANINLGVLLYDMHVYLQSIKHGGYLLLSGFFSEDSETIEKEVNQKPLAIYADGDWCQMLFKV